MTEKQENMYDCPNCGNVVDQVPAIAFRNKYDHDKYLAASIEFGDWSDKNLDVTFENIHRAYLIVRKDLRIPTDEDLKNHIRYHQEFKRLMVERHGESAFVSIDFDEIMKHYEPVGVSLTKEQYEKVKENWDDNMWFE